MPFAFEAFKTVLLLGTIQGFIVSGLLFFTGKRALQDRLLAKGILLITLCCLNLYLFHAQWFQSNPYLRLIGDLVPLVIFMPLGPLIYFHVQAVLHPGFSMGKKQRLHFYPVIIDVGGSLAGWIFLVGVLTGLIKYNPYPWGLFIDNYNTYSDIPRWISMAVYLWFSWRYVNAAGAGAPALAATPGFRWVRQVLRMLTIFTGIWLLYLIPYVIPRYSQRLLDLVDWYPVYVPMVVLIYWLGIKGYLMMAAQKAAPAKKPAAAALPAGAVEESLSLLVQAMEQNRLYLDPALNLSMLSQHTGIAPKTISAVLNQHLQKSFNEFVNGYRVQAFLEKLRQPGADQLTILALAFESGFNSQATFQRAFRNSTGMSPREYMAIHLKKQLKDRSESA